MPTRSNAGKILWKKHVVSSFLALGFITLSCGIPSNAPAATETWNATGAGDWNTATNWNPQTIPGVGDTAGIGITDPGSNIVVNYNTAMTALSFGALSIGYAGTSGTDTATLNINAAGFTSTGANLINGNGIINVNSGGVYAIQSTASNALVIGTTGGTIMGTLNVLSGGSLSVAGLTTINAGTINIADSSTFNGITLNSSGVNNSSVTITGGTNSLGAFIDNRDAASSPGAFGLRISGGTTTATSVLLGTSSWADMSVSGGAFTVTGGANSFTLGQGTTSGRGGSLTVSGGALTDTDTTTGLVLANHDNSPGQATFSGGAATLGKITLIGSGVDSSASAATTATMTLSGTGTVYVGSGGIVSNAGTGASTATVNLNGGTLGATADWSSSVAMNLGSSSAKITVQAADSSSVAHSITLSGPLTGVGGLIKTGTGKLTLSGTNTYSGATNVNAGTFAVNGTLASAVSVASNATLGGIGTLNGAVSVSNGGILLAGDGVSTSALTIDNAVTLASGSVLEFVLGSGNTHSTLALSSSFSDSFSSGLQIDLLNIQAGTYSNLITGLSTDPGTESHWALTNEAGYAATFTYSEGNISAVVAAVPEPASGQLMGLGVILWASVSCRFRRKAARG